MLCTYKEKECIVGRKTCAGQITKAVADEVVILDAVQRCQIIKKKS